MSELPIPATLRDFLKLDGPANRSLVFDRGMLHSQPKSETDKPAFFATFVREYKVHPGYKDFLGRRAAALKQLDAEPTTLYTTTRLVTGLGLPHPTETGFLFDRLTGCPYLPGSTVKGLLRAAATLVANWPAAEVDRIFGPVLGGEVDPATGCVVFYDAFPAAWPVLEVDVLTPHYPGYYRNGEPPGDWDNPNPVSFLTIRSGEAFQFWIGSRDRDRWVEDHEQLEKLLVLALDWLGIGAKKASGYGYLGKDAPAVAARNPELPPPPPPPPPPLPPAQETPWTNAELTWKGGSSPKISRGKSELPCPLELLPPELQELIQRVRKGKEKVRIQVDAILIKADVGQRVVRIEGWRRL